MPKEKRKRKLKENLKREIPPKPERNPGTNKLADKFRVWFFSPAFNVIALVILLLSVFGGLRILKGNNTQAQIKFVENATFNEVEKQKSDTGNISPPEIFHGEVYETSIRLRETGALGMAISLAVFGKVAEKGSVPNSLETVWSFINEQNLMPPGLKFENGELTSPTSIFLVRFKSQPFGFEILSSPKIENRGPSIMMRFPLRSFDGRTISYFQSPSTKTFEIPPAFASIEKVLASGWKIEEWRGELILNSEDSTGLLEKEKSLLEKLPKDH